MWEQCPSAFLHKGSDLSLIQQIALARVSQADYLSTHDKHVNGSVLCTSHIPLKSKRGEELDLGSSGSLPVQKALMVKGYTITRRSGVAYWVVVIGVLSLQLRTDSGEA